MGKGLGHIYGYGLKGNVLMVGHLQFIGLFLYFESMSADLE